MQILYFLSGMLLAGIAVRWGVRHLEQSRYLARIRDLEARLRFASGESAELKKQVAKLEGEAELLKKTFERELDSKEKDLTRLADSFRRSVFWWATCYFLVGLFVGGGAGWLSATARGEARRAMATADLELEARLARLSARNLENEVQSLRAEMADLERNYYEARVQKLVAETKLQILLDSLEPQKGKEGFRIAFTKLDQDLRHSVSDNELEKDVALFPISPLRH